MTKAALDLLKANPKLIKEILLDYDDSEHEYCAEDFINEAIEFCTPREDFGKQKETNGET